jgi:predicted permease
MQQAILEIIVLFIIMFFGYILGKNDIVDEKMSNKLSTLVLSGTFPALIIASMDRDFDMTMFKNSVILILFSIFILLAVVVYIEIETKVRKSPPGEMSARHFLMLFGNTSFMGIPVLNALYGSDGVFYAAVINIVCNFLMFSYGIFLLCRDEHPNFRKIFLNPGFIGTIIGFLLFVTPASLPYVIYRPLQWCGDMTIPLALLVAGSIISRNKLRDIIRPVSVWYTSIIRLVIYPIILIPVLLLLKVDTFLVSILVIIFATPAPLTAGAFVGNYGGDGFFASKVVVLSNLLSIITMTAMIYIFTAVIT